ncbi:1,4-alpha-glucan branching protein GlgB [Thiohalobacter sp. IOR34]|uniref:1,4-alpha-glucan branching protein GlgB n=1 Tax=Thiohalobacter sp. IOR34 TaxID=3057176 RepID=UPI0025B19D9E|nr:1,4-alpha-glucan branching protein GlgB [Thiohalobacter sp. IOR34]WJW76838.1 1,4-alpha-glucan branching protein GlgB [Thiohalobacter sp. IOR34]
MSSTLAHSDDILPVELERIAEARHHDPFAILGRHPWEDGEQVLVYLPGADRVRLLDIDAPLSRLGDSDFFRWQGPAGRLPERYRLEWQDAQGSHQGYDPYCFPPQLADFDLHLFGEGRHWHAYRFLGAHLTRVDGISGVCFAVWAPNAERVSVIGDFNQWDGRRHPMRVRGGSGVWELFLPGMPAGQFYKFEIRHRNSGAILVKSDPYGQQFELRPGTAALVPAPTQHRWADEGWMLQRRDADWQQRPMSIYEVHLGSWQRGPDGGFLSYRELAERLIPYAAEQGFTHVELLPVTEHPLDASWGYQTTGYFAPTSRFGSPDDFRFFVDQCHQHGLGVILDWAPAHFPRDAFALAAFDGEPLYEHADPRRGEHRDWGTLIFNYGRKEVKNFLLASAVYWLEEFHIDGLRVDAVASMIYLDYSREEGDWLPNQYGGNENLEAIDFLRELNQVTHGQHPGSVMIAEESTAWPQVTRPPWVGGLGFSMKWNMGWMHDTLDYLSKDPVFRHFHHDQLTFGLLYAFTENFVLPFSHDEVVHGKASMLHKMPGDEWQQFANLRLLYSYQWTYPGKKLLFMGSEFGQRPEWNFDASLEWPALDYPPHAGVQALVRDLNRIYREQPALHRHDFSAEGFEWIDCHDAAQSVISYQRRDGEERILVVLNFTPVVRHDYRLGVPRSGYYRVLLNSDSEYYGGSNIGEAGAHSEDIPWMGHPQSIRLTLPPLGALLLRLD